MDKEGVGDQELGGWMESRVTCGKWDVEEFGRHRLSEIVEEAKIHNEL